MPVTRTQKPRRIPGQTIPCGWCTRPITLRKTGRIPKWCSDACRHRAWEQRRAAASGRAAVRVVERFIEVEKDVRVVERVEVSVPIEPRTGEWPELLAKLAAQIDAGRVYSRDLDAIDDALNVVRHSMGRSANWAPRHRRRDARPTATSKWATRDR